MAGSSVPMDTFVWNDGKRMYKDWKLRVGKETTWGNEEMKLGLNPKVINYTQLIETFGSKTDSQMQWIKWKNKESNTLHCTLSYECM